MLDAMKLRLGLHDEASMDIPRNVNLGSMTEEERVALYVDWCKAIGMDITAEDILHQKEDPNSSQP